MCPCATRMRAATEIQGLRAPLDQTDNAEPSAGAQHAPRLGEGCCRIRHEHVAPAAKDAVDRIVRELDPLGVQDAVLDVRQTELGASTASDFGHRRAEVA